MAEAKTNNSDMELHLSIRLTYDAVKLCLSNRFIDAHNLLRKSVDTCMYHALGYGTISYLQALMTYEQEQIQSACIDLKRASAVCEKFRKKNTWTDSLSHLAGRHNYDDYSEVEIHAEICFAETLLLRAILTFVQDENLISFIKGALKMRQSYQLYKQCQTLMKKEPPSLKNTRSQADFDGGVKLGIGAFNLMISLLPTRILRLLEWVGFSGNRKYALQLLDEGATTPGLRAPLCAVYTLTYHVLISHFLGNEDYDLQYAQKLLDSNLKEFPEAMGFLFFHARLHQIKGHFDVAMKEYLDTLKVNVDWKQIHHVIYWEMMWCNCFKMEWKKACEYAGFLSKESKWSKTAYLYLKVSFQIMDEVTTAKSHFVDFSKDIDSLMSELPKYKQRVAGKSIPFEKFCIHRAQQFTSNNRFLAIPAIEIIYVWNGFSMLRHDKELLQKFFQLIIDCQQSLSKKEGEALPTDVNSYCLCEFLRGVCSKHLGDTQTAKSCYEEVIRISHLSKIDNHLAPFSCAELGFLLKEKGDHVEAKKQFDHTRKTYQKHFLISRLHFRIHAAIQAMDDGIENNDQFIADDVDPYDDGFDVIDDNLSNNTPEHQSSGTPSSETRDTLKPQNGSALKKTPTSSPQLIHKESTV